MGLMLGSCATGILDLPLEALLTHFVVIGATGSGKTGFLTVLVEELASASVPALVFDVKGDLANLAFWDEEWVKRAASEGLPVRGRLEAVVYTPGFCGGRPLKLLPPQAGDPISSAWAAEAILSLTRLSGDRGAQALLSTLLRRGKASTLSSLAKSVLEPPPTVLAGIPTEALVPEGSRRRLARELAALAVDPIVGCFSMGENLDFEAPPPVKVIYLAHLPERLRMLASSLILSEVYRWMMRVGGCSRPRLAVVFDEVRGYLPPYPRNPPVKDPLTTLVRQGRGFGVSVLLATQNPRDLDYKVLSNVGTWAVGVLRAKQDREAVAEALADVFGVSRSDVASRIAALKPREFLIFSTALERPEVVRVRHTLTPLKGPVTLDTLSRAYGWQGVLEEQPDLPQYTLVIGEPVESYKLCLLAKGVAAYKLPGRKARTLREFTAIVDPYASRVALLEGSPAVKPGAPHGVSAPPIGSLDTLYARSKGLLVEALTEKTYVTSRGDRPRPGESLEEFQARIATELEERKRRVDERYRVRLSKLIARAEKVSRKREEVGSLVNILKPLLSRRTARASLFEVIERWKRAREKAAELEEKERELLAEIERLRAEWFKELKRLEDRYAIKVREVKPEIVELQLELLWVPERWSA
ncbi:MAG: ATP-binding protein [Thermofilaceae archaeon]